MRLLRHASAAVSLLVMVCSISTAGVYNPAEMGKTLEPTGSAAGVKPLPFDLFRLALDDAMQLQVAVPNVYAQCAAAIAAGGSSTGQPADLAWALSGADEQKWPKPVDRFFKHHARHLEGKATLEEKVSLGAYWLRLGRPDEAINLLEPLYRGEGRSNFMVIANLASAYQMMGDPQSLQRADDYLRTALSARVWPKEWPGISKEQLDWYKECENAQLKLGRVRRKELAAQGGKGKPPEAVDDYFGVKYVGESGAFEPGAIAAAEKEKLPKEALALVQQLMLWHPDDSRMYWQLGELLNAQGDIDSAKAVLDQCSDSRRMNAVALRQHRQALKEAIDNRPKDVEVPTSWLPERNRLIAISAGSGLLVLLLLGLQFRELAKRWRWFE